MFDKFEDCLKYFKDNILNIIIENKLFPLEIDNISTYELHRPLSPFEINYYYNKNLGLKNILHYFLKHDKFPYNCFFISKYTLILFEDKLKKIKLKNKDKLIDDIVLHLKKQYDPIFIDKAYFFKNCRKFQSTYSSFNIKKLNLKNKYEIKYKIFNGPQKTMVISHSVLDESFFYKKVNEFTLSNYDRSSIITKIKKMKFDFAYNYLIDDNYNNYIYKYNYYQ